MKNKIKISIAAMLLLLGSIVPFAQAATISFDANNVAGNTWQVNYSVTNDAFATDLEEFSVVFDLGLYENISVFATPAGWDSIVFQPDSSLPDDGLYDVLALAGGIVGGNTLAGFGVQFDFLGAGAPGSQTFAIVDPIDFSTLEEGLTTQSAVVPLPAAVWLFLSGFLLLLGFGSNKVKNS